MVDYTAQYVVLVVELVEGGELAAETVGAVKVAGNTNLDLVVVVAVAMVAAMVAVIAVADYIEMVQVAVAVVMVILTVAKNHTTNLTDYLNLME